MDAKDRSPNYEVRPNGWTPTLLIVHYTATGTFTSPYGWLRNPVSQVSAHYLIDRTGKWVQLVDTMDAAWHAGKSAWAGHRQVRGSLNATSIGYELVNRNNGRDSAPEAQIATLTQLLYADATRYAIPIDRAHIVGHYEVSPGRKTDPDTLDLDAVVARVQQMSVSTYTVIRDTGVRESPDDAAPIAWGGTCILPVGQVIDASPAGDGWLHWPAGGFVRAVDVVAGDVPSLEPTHPVYPPVISTPAVIDEHLPVIGVESAFTPDQAIAYLTTPDRLKASGYTDHDIRNVIIPTYAKVCADAGVRFDVAVAQMIHETGALSSFWCRRPQRNPAGIGVNGEWLPYQPTPAQGWAYNNDRKRWERGLSFSSWDVAISAQIYRLLRYAAKPGSLTQEQQKAYAQATADRPLPAQAYGSAPTIKYLGAIYNLANVDLPRARWVAGWAWDGKDYGVKIAAIIRSVRGQDNA